MAGFLRPEWSELHFCLAKFRRVRTRVDSSTRSFCRQSLFIRGGALAPIQVSSPAVVYSESDTYTVGNRKITVQDWLV